VYGVLLGAIGSSVVLAWRLGNLPFSRRLREFELATYDDRMNWRGPVLRAQRDEPVVIVAIDETSLTALADEGMLYPWPRDVHARLIRQLVRGGAKVIAFDINFQTVVPAPNQKPPGPEDYLWEPAPCAADLAFAEAIDDAGNVILAAVVEEKIERVQGQEELIQNAAYPAALFDDAAAAHADAKTPIDLDGTVRRARTESRFREERLVSFPVVCATAYEADGPVEELEARATEFGAQWRGRHAESIDGEGAFPVDFHGPPGETPTVQYLQALGYGPEQLRATFGGKIVLIGATSPDLHDQFTVPIRRKSAHQTGEEQMAGVEIHANAIRTLLADRCIRPAPFWVAIVWTLLLGCVTGIATFYLRPLPTLVFYLPVVGFATIALSFWLSVTRDLWVNVTLPVLGALAAAYVTSTVFAYFTVERERNHIQRAWSKRVSPEVLQQIIQNPRLQHVEGRTLQATVLFSDLRGFTTLCHAWPPAEVVRRLNEIFDRMTRVIMDHGGAVDKFIGDGIMAIFGDPVPYEDHARRAVLASIGMLRAMKELQAAAVARGDQPIRMGVGIHTGELVAGDIGSELFLEYTAIGDTVSTASRLEGLNKDYSTNIICSGDALAQAGEGLPVRLIGTTTVRGRETPLKVYEVLWEKQE
jgi:adenylate cyclase